MDPPQVKQRDPAGACGAWRSPARPERMNVVSLTRDLVACPSVTPANAGALEVIEAQLALLGFNLHRLRFGGIENLVAERPGPGARLGFAGHSDVVPIGPREGWRADPFAGDIVDGALIGRGAADMKGAIAAFIAAVSRRVASGHADNLVLVITGDEEGDAVDGTVKLMPWLEEHGLLPEACIVGEPTSLAAVGDVIKVGRRGSTNMRLTVRGRQGHVAYPQRSDNPVTRLVRILADLKAAPLDGGTAEFEPSNLEITALEAGEGAPNVIPGSASARLNIRFNTNHTGDELEAWVRAVAQKHAAEFTLEARCSGEAFLTPPCGLRAKLGDAVEAVTGRRPESQTGGGTSDARFIRHYCPVVELGLVGTTMHQVNEAVPIADLHVLTDIYAAFLSRWFNDAGS